MPVSVNVQWGVGSGWCRVAAISAGFLRESRRYILCGYGGTGGALCRELLRHGRRPAYIVDVHPGRQGMRIHGAPVVAPEEIGRLERLPIIASVAGAEARRKIRTWLREAGYEESIDFICAA